MLKLPTVQFVAAEQSQGCLFCSSSSSLDVSGNSWVNIRAYSLPFGPTDLSAADFLATVLSFSTSSSFSKVQMTLSLGRCAFPAMLLREVSFIAHQPFSEISLPPKMTFRYSDMVPKSSNAKALTW